MSLSSAHLVPAAALLTVMAVSRAAAADAAASPQRDEAPHDARRAAASEGGAWQLRAGGTYRRLYDVPIYAGQFGGAFGGWDDDGGDYVAVDLILPGRTEQGLAVIGSSIGYRSDWQLSKLRLGFSAGLTFLEMARKTTDESMKGGGFALSAFAGYDILRTPGSALAVDLALNADALVGDQETDDALLWGPTLGLSYRL